MLVIFLLFGACFTALMQMCNSKVINKEHKPEHASQMLQNILMQRQITKEN